MGVDLRIYLVSRVGSESWWCNTSIALERENDLWARIEDANVEEPVPQFVEAYTYGPDGNTRFVLDLNSYGKRVTYAKARHLGQVIAESKHFEFNRRVGELLMSLSEYALVVLYWH